jgi:trehalose-6-phosphatase
VAEWLRLEDATDVDLSWHGEVAEIMKYFTERTPGAVLHANEATLVWAYADADPDFGPVQARDLQLHLDSMLFTAPAEVVLAQRKRFVFVRPLGVSKGALVAHLLSHPRYGSGVRPARLGGNAGPGALTASRQPGDAEAKGEAKSTASASQEQRGSEYSETPQSGSGVSSAVSRTPTSGVAAGPAAALAGPAPYFSFVLCMGDERTDEDLYPHARAFAENRGQAAAVQPRGQGQLPGAAAAIASSPLSAMPSPGAAPVSGFAVTVGRKPSAAQSYVPDAAAAVALLEALVAAGSGLAGVGGGGGALPAAVGTGLSVAAGGDMGAGGGGLLQLATPQPFGAL